MLLFLSAPSFAQLWSGVLAPARATDWSNAGIPGGIPSGGWSNCTNAACATAFSSPTVPNVRAACTGAPANTVVRIPAGSYTWGSSVYCNKSNVVLRGAGPQQTFITLGSGANILMGSGTGGQGDYPTGIGKTNWTGGLTQGSTVLTVASTNGMSAGQTVILTQQNAPYVYPDGVEGICTSGNSCGVNPGALSFTGAETYAQLEIVLIQSVNSSTQLTIAAPGVSHDYSSGLAPIVFYWNSPKNYQYMGIESMSVNVNGNDHALSLPFCDYCWVKNVAMTNATNRGDVFFYFGYRDEADNNYIGGDTAIGHPTQYGFDLLETTFAKVQNNIIVNETSPVMTEGSYGTVLGYNYVLRNIKDNQFGALDTHLSHAFMQLWEGNVAGTLEYDNSWGSASHMTAFRNAASGHDPNATNFRVAMKVNGHNHSVNLVGNVIGDPTFHTQYVCDNTHVQSTDNFEYDLGFWNSCDQGINSSNPYDTVTESSLMRWGNWDAVTYNASGAAHHGTRWCTGTGTGAAGADASNSGCSDETASSDPSFPGLSNPGTTLPSSFYLSSQPSWFSTVWGTPAWPPIGPDLTCTTNCIVNAGNHAAKIPAQLCYENTAKDSSGFVTAFDANACYNSGLTPPPAPTGNKAVAR